MYKSFFLNVETGGLVKPVSVCFGRRTDLACNISHRTETQRLSRMADSGGIARCNWALKHSAAPPWLTHWSTDGSTSHISLPRHTLFNLLTHYVPWGCSFGITHICEWFGNYTSSDYGLHGYTVYSFFYAHHWNLVNHNSY